MTERYCRAANLVGPKEVGIAEVPVPALEPGEALVQVEMAGVCGTDVHLFNEASEFPMSLGHEPVARIVEIAGGSDLRDYDGQPLALGDRVVWAPYTQPKRIAGAFADYAVIIPRTRTIFRVPDSVPTEHAVLTEPAACALRLVERAFQTITPDCHLQNGIGMGRTLLIEGSGPIGALATGLAKLRGIWRVVVVGAPQNRLDICKAAGADLTLNFLETSDDERAIAIRDICKGGPDAVIESAGAAGAFQEGLELVREGGTIVELGFAPETDRGRVEVDVRLLVAKGVALLGSLGFQVGDFSSVLRTMETDGRWMGLSRLVTHHYPLSKVQDALEIASRCECMKAVIQPGVGREVPGKSCEYSTSAV